MLLTLSGQVASSWSTKSIYRWCWWGTKVSLRGGEIKEEQNLLSWVKVSWKKNIFILYSFSYLTRNKIRPMICTLLNSVEILIARLSCSCPAAEPPAPRGPTAPGLQAHPHQRWFNGDRSTPAHSSIEKSSPTNYTTCNMICEWKGGNYDWSDSPPFTYHATGKSVKKPFSMRETAEGDISLPDPP